MHHAEVIEALAACICDNGRALSSDIQEHLGSCKSCLSALAVFSELVKIDAKEWYEQTSNELPCQRIQDELDRYAGMEPKRLISEAPTVAYHFRQCGDCRLRYLTARDLIQADTEGLLGAAIELHNVQPALWETFKEKVFQIASEVKVVAQSGFIEFQGLQGNLLANSFYLTPAGTTRSDVLENRRVVAQEVYFCVTPPSLGTPLKIRFLSEAEGFITVIIETKIAVKSQIVVALYEVSPHPTLVEVRSMISKKSPIRFERLPPTQYSLEIRGPGGIANIPLHLQARIVE